MHAWSEESNYGHEKTSTISCKLFLSSRTPTSTAQVHTFPLDYLLMYLLALPHIAVLGSYSLSPSRLD